MLLGVIADDFTGASDIANTLKKAGMKTALVSGIPSDLSLDSDAIVVALKSRSIPADDAVKLSLSALDWLRKQNCLQFVFKYCSTFDSTPCGNIGPVTAALADALHAQKVICCPALPANGRTVYQGHLFVNDKLLSESGMENHPLNPMTDPNIRRWLGLQIKEPIGLIDLATVRIGVTAIETALNSADERLFIADATSLGDLINLGFAMKDQILVTGGSGIAEGLPENYRRRGQLGYDDSTFNGTQGNCVILAGSCSQATLAQVSSHRTQAPSLQIKASELLSSDDILSKCMEFAEHNRASTPLIYSSDQPAEIAKTQAAYGVESLAAKIEVFFGVLADRLVKIGFSRIIVAGGETSGAVVTALGIKSFVVGPEIVPGVPCLAATREKPLAMALKSGNFGGSDFFARAAKMLAGQKS